MEIPVVAGPWLVLGAVLGIALPALVALAVTLPRRRRTRPAPPSEPVVDDLPHFLDSPPGAEPSPVDPASAWPSLSAPPAPPAAQPAPRSGGTRGALVAMAVTAVLLVGAAALVAAVRSEDRPAGDPPAPAPAARPRAVAADLTFDGVVLDRHAVGVTAAYPRLRLTVRDDRPTAELVLETFNCLSDSAPEDPVTAGCSRVVPEFAELGTPDVTVRTGGDGVRISGAFPTSRRPNGSAPVPTGRVYQLAVDVTARDGAVDEEREPAVGDLRLGGESAGTSEAGPNELTYGG